MSRWTTTTIYNILTASVRVMYLQFPRTLVVRPKSTGLPREHFPFSIWFVMV